MNVQVGPYVMTVPDVDPGFRATQIADVRSDSVSIPIGPFTFNANLSDSDLEHWREFVGYTTKYQAVLVALEVNGIPGFTQRPTPGSDRRLDYIFQAKDCKSISIVAWSDVPTTPSQREVIDRAVHTIRAIKKSHDDTTVA
jgi:hypothetical protein